MLYWGVVYVAVNAACLCPKCSGSFIIYIYLCYAVFVSKKRVSIVQVYLITPHAPLAQLFFRFGNTSWYITAMSESFLYPIIFTIFNILVSQFNFTSIGMVLFPGWCLRAGGALFQTVPPHLRPHRVPQPCHPVVWLPNTSGKKSKNIN